VALSADILVVGRLSPDEAVDLAQSFATVGLSPDLREVPPRRSLGDIAWLALIAVPLKPFYEQLAKDFATDAHRRLKALTMKLLHREAVPSSAPQVLVLQDSRTGIAVVIEPDLPDVAFEQLLTFNLSGIRRGPVHYDRHRRRWRSELDEAAASSPGEA